METRIDSTRFGAIRIDGQVYKHDVLIRLDGKVKKRKKKLSKALYGTSHLMSLAEAEYIYEDGAERLIYGTGQFARSKLSNEAAAYFETRGCQVELLPTPKAARAWNQAEGAVLGVFHISC